MILKVFKDADDLAMASAKILCEYIQAKPDALCCFAAGRTQIPTYTILAQWVKKGDLDISRIRVVGLDEIVGASRAGREGFHYFLDMHLFGPCGISDSQVHFMDAQAQNTQDECTRVNAWLDENGPIDFLLLGIGGNGHIGYNEPGVDPQGRTHTVVLEGSSIAAGQTYFDHNFEAGKGMTLGMADLLAASTVLVQATGASKAPAIASLQAGKVTSEVPVTYLLKRTTGVEFFADQAASTGVE